MLESLSIRELGLISNAELELHPGLVVISGETGAGKTLLLEAVNALAGGKPSMAGTSADTAVDGTIRPGASVLSAVAELGAEVEAGSVMLSRWFPLEGRAKAVVGGRPVPANVLKGLAEQWLAVHGQHDTLRLLKTSTHRDLLDRHGGQALRDAAAACQSAFRAWQGLQRELEDARTERAALLANIEAIRADVALCQSLELAPGEDAEIAAKIERLARTEQIQNATATAQEGIAGEGGAISAIGGAARALEHSITGDELVDQIVQRLKAVVSELADLSHEVAVLADGLEVEPSALDSLMLRQRQIRTLLVRHGPTMSDLLAWFEGATRQLELADPDGHALAQLAEAVAAARASAEAAAQVLTTEREATASKLSVEVQDELRSLAMPFALFEVAVEPKELSDAGADKVEFRFSANPGLPTQPIVEAASGGELSRLMLALEVTLSADAQDDGPSTMIFDEVDAGVAGAAATAVAERLARLSKYRQVIVVSHLAQIAAMAHQQLKVEKDSNGFVTSTTVIEVAQESRIGEIARMLAGVEESTSAQAHAAELLQAAEKTKRALERQS